MGTWPMISAADILGGATIADILGEDVARLSDEEDLQAIEEREARERAASVARYQRQRQLEHELAGIDVTHAELMARREVVLCDPADAEARIRAKRGQKYDHVNFYLGRARQALASGRRLLVLSGAKGRGKSMIQNLIIAEMRGRVIEARHLGPEGTWLKDDARSSITRMTKAEILTGHRALAIDDFGQEGEKIRIATVEAMNDVIPSRCSRQLLTIISTNLVTDREAERLKRVSPGSSAAIDATRLTTWMGPRWDLFEARVREHGRIITVWGRDLRPEMED